MKKRSHADPASTAVVIQPRHSLGGKQASGATAASVGDDTASTKKRVGGGATPATFHPTGSTSLYDAVMGPTPPLPLPPPPPLHPHHLSALDPSRFGSNGGGYGGNGGGAGSGGVLLARAGSGSAASLLANTQDVVLSGVLMKRAPFFKHWMPRYFVLTKSSLAYYSKNPSQAAAAQGGAAPHKDLAALEKRLLRGEIARGDVLRVEPTDAQRNHPFSFVVVARRRSRASTRFGRGALSCMFTHHKETRLGANKKKKHASGGGSAGHDSGSANVDSESDGAVMTYYIQAPHEEDRKKWVKTLQRWVDGESPAKLGRAILEYIVDNEYSATKYEHKVGDCASSSHDLWGYCNGVSPAAQAGRRIEEEHAVLANLIRDMHECQQEDEMIFILDQILGEVKDGAFSGYVKKLIAAAGEAKLETSSAVWTTNVKAAYGAIMKALYTQKKAAALASASAASNSASAQPRVPMGPPTARSSTLRPTLLAPKRQTSDGGESAPEFSFHRSYKLGRKLGSGAYSVVHIATHRETRKQVAVKCIAKSSLSLSDVRSLKHEVEIMRTLNHPNIVPLLGYFEEPRYYYIVTPLCTGGELFDALVKRKSYTEEDARAVMKKITDAIKYFHARGVVHRDLKPENILLKTSAPDAEVMIADFGFARSMRGEKRLTACGTPGYVAPEVVRGEAYGAEVDCWSLGVILYILLCGYPPFGGENHVAIFEKVVAANYKFESPDWDDVSEEAKDLVRKLLTVDRSQRLTAAQVLEHPWMNPGVLPAATDAPEAKRLVRVSSDLISALSQMRKHSLTHEVPKIRPSDMDVDVLELTRESMELDVDLLDRELANLDF